MGARYTITASDYLAAMQLHARPTRLGLALTVLGVLLLVGVLGFGLRSWIGAGVAAVLGGIAGWLLMAHLAPWHWRRHYEHHPVLREEMGLALHDDGLHISAAFGDSHLRWPEVTRWRENERFVLVYVSRQLFHPIPKSLAQQGLDLQRLRALLRQHHGPAF